MLGDQLRQQLTIAYAGLRYEITGRKYERQRFANGSRSGLNSGEGILSQFQTLPPRS